MEKEEKKVDLEKLDENDFKEPTEEELVEMEKHIYELMAKDLLKYKERFYKAKKEMNIAEYALVSSFNEKQKQLYDEFFKKREVFYEKAKKVYEQKIIRQLD